MTRPSVKVAYVNGDQTLIANLEVYKDRMTDAVADPAQYEANVSPASSAFAIAAS